MSTSAAGRAYLRTTANALGFEAFSDRELGIADDSPGDELILLRMLFCGLARQYHGYSAETWAMLMCTSPAEITAWADQCGIVGMTEDAPTVGNPP